jgi:hypothetical protein
MMSTKRPKDDYYIYLFFLIKKNDFMDHLPFFSVLDVSEIQFQLFFKRHVHASVII